MDIVEEEGGSMHEFLAKEVIDVAVVLEEHIILHSQQETLPKPLQH